MDLSQLRYDQYNVPLAGLYTTVALLSGFQIARILYYKHKLLGFQVWFLLFCFATALVRALCFFFIFSWSSTALFLVVYWTPSWLQFATFSFLLLFYYATMYYNEVSGRQRAVRVGLLLYTLVNAAFALFLAVAVALVSTSGSEGFQLALIHTQQVLQALMWALLIAALAFYGWKVSALLERDIRVPFHPRDLSPSAINSATLALFLIFATRCLWDIVSVATGGFGASLEVDQAGNPWWKQLVLFSLFSLWEIIPALTVLAMFWHIPKTQVRADHVGFRPPGSRSRAGTGGPGTSLQDPLLQPALPRAHLLETDSRYDSDDDERPPRARAYGTLDDPARPAVAAPPAGPSRSASAGFASSSWGAFSSTGAYSPYVVPPIAPLSVPVHGQGQGQGQPHNVPPAPGAGET